MTHIRDFAAFADQRAHDVAWMTADERNALNPEGQPFTLEHRLIIEPLGTGDQLRPSCACGKWAMHGYVHQSTAHALFAAHCGGFTPTEMTVRQGIVGFTGAS